MENSITDVGMPSCLYTCLYYDMNEKCSDYLVMLKEELVNKLQPLVAGCPSKEELMNATKYSLLDWE
eukprot:10429938-Ditylum_brightwellii.AAC.1